MYAEGKAQKDRIAEEKSIYLNGLTVRKSRGFWGVGEERGKGKVEF
jgi:hypothetical protein